MNEIGRGHFIQVSKVNSILTVIENIAFLLFGYWDYTALAGSLWGLAMTTLFFYMICVSVPKALRMEDPELAQKHIRATSMGRTLVLGVGIFLAFKLPFINWVAALIPLVFTRISISVLHLEREEEN